MPAAEERPSGTFERDGGHQGDAHAAAFDQADPDGRGLRYAVERRPDGDGGGRPALRVPRVFAALAAPAGDLPVREVEDRGPEQQPGRRRVQPPYLVRLVHELEGDGGDEHAGPKRHDDVHEPPRGASRRPRRGL